MFRKGAVLISGLLMAALSISCGLGQRSDSQPPAGQQQATQSQPAAPPVQQATPQEQPAAAQKAEPPDRAEVSPAPAAVKTARPGSSAPKTAAPAAPGKAVPAATAPTEPVTHAVVPENPPRPADVPAAVPPKPQPVRFPSGTRFEVRLADPIDSSRNKSGDVFRATLEQDLLADGKVIIPKGSIVTGSMSNIKPSGRVEGRATLSVTLTKVAIGDASYAIQTNTLSFEAESTRKEDATKVGIGAGIGAIIGAIAGGGKGAAIGAAVGGGAGTATVLATKGREVKFQPEERFSFVLLSDLEIVK